MRRRATRRRWWKRRCAGRGCGGPWLLQSAPAPRQLAADNVHDPETRRVPDRDTATGRGLAALPLQQRGQVREGDGLLGRRAEVAQDDVPVGQLVADDYREPCAGLHRRLELPAELSRREIDADCEPGGP